MVETMPEPQVPRPSRWTRSWEATAGRRVHILVSLAAVILAALHVCFPSVSIDAITLVLLVLAVLPWTTHLIKSIELPGGAKLELVAQPVDVRRRIAADEVAQELEIEPATTSKQSPAPTRSNEQVGDMRTRHLQVEDLALRFLEETEFRTPLQRQVMIEGNPNLAVDAVGLWNDALTIIEVKYMSQGGIRILLVEQYIEKLRRIATAYGRIGSASVSRVLLLIVIEGDSALAESNQASLRNRWGWDSSLDLRVISRSTLLRRFNLA